MKKNKKNDFPYLGNTKQRIRKMKLTLILTLLVFVSFGNSFSQVKLSMQMDKATIKEVIANIEDQTDYIFLYKDELFDQNKLYSLDFNDVVFEEILNSVCKTANVDYEMRNNRQIILKEKTEKTVLYIAAQQKVINGTVTSSSGEPLPGVSVVVKGTTIGTITNPDGSFQLQIPESAEILQFSFIGMKTQEVERLGIKQLLLWLCRKKPLELKR